MNARNILLYFSSALHIQTIYCFSDCGPSLGRKRSWFPRIFAGQTTNRQWICAEGERQNSAAVHQKLGHLINFRVFCISAVMSPEFQNHKISKSNRIWLIANDITSQFSVLIKPNCVILVLAYIISTQENL